jgi:hypothetical protein
MARYTFLTRADLPWQLEMHVVVEPPLLPAVVCCKLPRVQLFAVNLCHARVLQGEGGVVRMRDGPIAFRREGSHSPPFRTSARYVYVLLQPAWAARMSRLRPPLRLLPTPRWNFNQVHLTLLSVDTEPQRIMDTFIKYGLFAVPSAQCNAVYGTPYRDQ